MIKSILILILTSALAFAGPHKVDIQQQNATVKSFADQFTAQTGIPFSYESSLASFPLGKVSLKAEDTYEALLGKAFQGKGIDFKVVNDMVVLAKAPQQIPAQGASGQNPQAERITVSGTVVDESGQAVIGAIVMEKGNSSNGVAVDMDGNYSIRVPSNATLVYECLSYLSVEEPVNSRGGINVVMRDDSQQLEEVVVVGYGIQKKVNLTGSVSAINMDELTESRPITNVSQALAGLAAGVQVTSANNAPGNDNATILVRGQGTLNSSAPLVIIDGVEGSFNSVNPQDIESISILKDAASASIYGSRAAGGVILITTKSGKAGDMKISYDGYASLESIRKTLTPVSDYADYMLLINEGLSNSGKARVFPDSDIKAWRDDAGKHPLLYPNRDWIDDTFRRAVAQNHVVTVSGGSEKIHAFASLGYSNNPGVMENTGYSKYTARLNVGLDIKRWLSVGIQFSGNIADMEAGHDMISTVFTYASATTPSMILRSKDGRYGAPNNPNDDIQTASNNPLKRLNSVQGENRSHAIKPRFTAEFKPFKGMSVTASYTYDWYDNQLHTKPVFIDSWNFLTNSVVVQGEGRTNIRYRDAQGRRIFSDVVARYSTDLFSKLHVDLMGGASQESYRSENFEVSRQDLIDLNMDVLNAAYGDASTSGTRGEWRMRSYFGRMNLNWADRYLAEFNLRADGSSRFARGHRWGYFPSASFAWRADNEAFFSGIRKAAGWELLKLRFSYGALGNNSVGNYDSQDLYTSSNGSFNYVLGDAMQVGLAQAALSNPNLTWESTYVADIGMDFGLLKNRLTGTIDWFHKKTVDILISLPAPDVHGTTSVPKVNSATVSNRGIEIALGWKDTIGDFNYGINGNLSFIRNRVDKFKGRDKGGMSVSGANLIWEGHSINSQYLLKVDRILQTDEDMALVRKMYDEAPLGEDGQPVNPFAAFYGSTGPQKGDLLYRDMDGNGIIDNNDKVIVSDGPNPKCIFGINLSASWKGFDFSALLQGQAGIKVYWLAQGYNTPTVRWGYQLNREVMVGRWYEGRTDATYPRLLDVSDYRNQQMSDFYLQDKSFLKVRNIQLGYSLPDRVIEKIGAGRIRVYGSLENFLTFTRYKGWDPEVSGMGYPTMRQVVFGVNVSF